MKILLLNIFVTLCTCTDALNSASSNTKYNYDTCSHDTKQEHSVSGAVISANTAQVHLLPINCTTTFKSADADEVFLVQVTQVNIRRRRETCIDSLTVINYDESNSQVDVLLENFCGRYASLPVKKKFYTNGRILNISWRQAAAKQTKSSPDSTGFSMILTSVSKPPVVCEGDTHLRCSNDDCINLKLLCDGVPHCIHGEDEYNCPKVDELTSAESITTNSSQGHTIMSTISLIANFTLVTSTTTETTSAAKTTSRVPIATTPADFMGWDVGSPDLISVAIVGSVFAVVLVVCIILGCREKKEPEAFRSNSQINSNPGYSDSNGPPTPPPTYAYIERQTSYVSDISQRSSQISVPPDYDDALDMPDSPSGRRRSRRRSRLSRSSTGGSSRRNRSRFPFFRSFSAQETLARYRARNSTPVELVPPARPSQLGSETDTLPSLREQDQDDNTSPSDDNVFESPPTTLETRVQVEPGGESRLATPGVRQSPSAPSELQCIARDSSPEHQRLLSDGSQQQPDAAPVSEQEEQTGEALM